MDGYQGYPLWLHYCRHMNGKGFSARLTPIKYEIAPNCVQVPDISGYSTPPQQPSPVEGAANVSLPQLS